MKVGSQSWKFNNNVYLLETATAVGPLESQGPSGITINEKCYSKSH